LASLKVKGRRGDPARIRGRSAAHLIEAKSAGTSQTSKRRKEGDEGATPGDVRENVRYAFLCGYFGSDYLGYEAAEGIDWVWEHRIDDLAKLGL
jgi:type II restriction enzyme